LTTHNRIQTTIDVGANTGDFAEELRLSGFPGRIISFEPTSEAFKVLAARSKRDPLWSVHQAAIGETTGEMRINVAANEARSSSFLPMLDLHQKFAPTSLYVSSEIVSMKTLGEALDGKVQPGERLLLKIDTQGYEENVLRGAGTILPQVEVIECELSLVPLYEGQLLFTEMLAVIKDLGFSPVQFAPGFTDPRTGNSLQVDVMFSRSGRAEA